MNKPSIPKGTRDFSPVEMSKRNYIFDTIKSVFTLHGFKQIETPAMETLQTLLGKYGEEGDKLLFKVLNSGDFLNKVNREDLLKENSLHLAYTLRQASELMNHYGYAAEAEAYRAEYDKLVKAVKKVAWDENRKMFADYAGAKTFSQHPNIMAILSDAIPASEQKRLFEKIISDKSLTQCTFYYRFYLTEAMLKVGLADMYVSELKPWRDMLGIGLSTFAENPEPTRSDCHAWSSSPNYHLLSLVCGVRPGSYGFKSVRIEPHLCGLNYIKGVIPHPLGNISVDLKRAGENSVEGTVELPKGLDGEFVWNGKSLKLSAGKNAVNPM